MGVAQRRIASVRLVPGSITPVVVVCRAALCASVTMGVGQIRALKAIAFRVKSLFPAARFPFWAGVPAIGVGHAEPAFSALRSACFLRCKEASRRREAQAP